MQQTRPFRHLCRIGPALYDLVLFFALLAGWCLTGLRHEASGATTPAGAVPVLGYRVIRSFPHDPSAFTQGLLFDSGILFESTGLRGKSTVRRVRLENGEVLASRSLASPLFGEGLALQGGRLFQLTWDSGNCFVYDPSDLKPTGEFSFDSEGWGLATDGKKLMLSDGTPVIRFMDPATFAVNGNITVRDGAKQISDLNELEYIDGEIYANVWKTNRIVRISPTDGKVTAWIDLSGLHSFESTPDPEDVLNGIAWDAPGRRLFVTGKRWDALYEIELVPAKSEAPGKGGCLLGAR